VVPTELPGARASASWLTRREAGEACAAGASARPFDTGPEAGGAGAEPRPPAPDADAAELPAGCVDEPVAPDEAEGVFVVVFGNVVVLEASVAVFESSVVVFESSVVAVGTGGGGGVSGSGAGGGASNGVVVWGIGGGGAGIEPVTEVRDSSAPQACTGTAKRTANTSAAAEPTFARLTEAFPWLLERKSIRLDNGTPAWRVLCVAPPGSAGRRAGGEPGRRGKGPALDGWPSRRDRMRGSWR
jgi:hypothetical protein